MAIVKEATKTARGPKAIYINALEEN